MNKKKLIVIGAVVLLISIGAVVYMKRKKTAGPIAQASGAADTAAAEREYIMDYIVSQGYTIADIDRIKTAPPEVIVKMHEALLAHNNAGHKWTGIEALNAQWEATWRTLRNS